ncbi:TOG array regulator of axonemal microtubules protein 1-like [Salminus brasiliensis]|uniref:TOG array regulator of axonemal microtubules protein 1-like n=1 Tax=Salminus brasiliensis TaxID=930266 RepID=UPI003B83797D
MDTFSSACCYQTQQTEEPWCADQGWYHCLQCTTERKTEGLKLIRALAAHHAEILLPKLHDICLAVIKEVRNLRSVVCRAAMTTLAHLYAHLQKKMDQEVESTARVLLHKAGESHHFIKEDVEVALSMMVHNCSPGRVLRGLLAGGLSHRNAAVKRCTALHLEKLAHLLGASRVLTAKKEFTCRFLTAVSKLALDPAQEVRLHAQNTLRFLGSHEACVKMMDRFVPLRDKTAIKGILSKTR